MSDRAKANLLKYGISTAVVVFLAGTYIGSRNFMAMTRMEQYRTICDAFTIPGLLLILIGCMVWIGNEGGLDMLSYAVSKAVGLFVPGVSEKGEKYYDYVQRKRENRLTGYGFLFIVGGIAMVIALVNMFLFYQLYS